MLLIAVGAAAGSLYRAGYLGNRQESVASEIRSMFSANRIAGVEVTVSKDWIATVSGVVTSDSRRRQILTLLQQNDDIRSVRSEGLRVRPEPDAVERSLSADLVAAGARFAAVRVAVMPDYSVMVSGSVAGNEDAEKVRELIKASQWIARAEFDLAVTTSESSASGTPVSGTPASPVRDAAPPAALAVDAAPARQAPGPAAGAPALASQQVVDAVRSALAKAGVHGITAAAVAGQVVVLKGAVSSRAAKDAAFESARRAAPGYTVRDQVFIVD